ncbi:MAG: tRNA uridine-5-carboxymethylaminomethyl(34) synthesis GTPase MnmE [Bacteroidales bacterium]|nr:tRNA uridine-5-carboxymethylaminomethyl(34) synthesis GTPase MnmE [Bacteroidales bacterium]
MIQNLEDTIIAPATTPGTGAITVIRMSGPKTFGIVNDLVLFKKGSIEEASGYTIKFGTIFNDDFTILDEVLVSVFKAPHSYTGEDSVEISCHASKYIVEQILLKAIHLGARAAEPGEFTKRAFTNGKMDLAQAEAVADVISSSSAASLRVAMSQLKGGVSSELKTMREDLLNITSLMELELDFSEEDVEFADRSQLTDLIDKVYNHITKLANSFKTGNAIKNGVPVAIVGPTNAGKSTLLNTLLGEERAIVSDIAGTTRDTIEETMTIEGILFRFIDTAGIRESDDAIEKIGIERTYKKIGEADVVLGVVDCSDSSLSIKESIEDIICHTTKEQSLFIVLNKSDKENISTNEVLSTLPDIKTISISAKFQTGIEELKAVLADSQKGRISLNDETLITNIRHYKALSDAAEALDRVKNGLGLGIPTDLLSQDLRECLYHLGTIVGEISTDEVLGNIFSKFCIGK